MQHLRGINAMSIFSPSGWPKFAANKLVDHSEPVYASSETNASLAAFHSRFQVNRAPYMRAVECAFHFVFHRLFLCRFQCKIHSVQCSALHARQIDKAIVIHPVDLYVRFGIPCTRIAWNARETTHKHIKNKVEKKTSNALIFRIYDLGVNSKFLMHTKATNVPMIFDERESLYRAVMSVSRFLSMHTEFLKMTELKQPNAVHSFIWYTWYVFCSVCFTCKWS